MALLHPTHQYAVDVVAGKIPVCRYVILACQRHLDDLGRKDIYFDEAAANRFFKYCTHLHHYKGAWKGKPLELEPWQKFFWGNIYGWKRSGSGLWRFNYGEMEVPRKNGKTTQAAAGASYDAGFVESTGAEVYCLATKEDQAKLLYNDVNAYISASSELQNYFEVMRGKNMIFAARSARTSFIKPLGSDSETLDGLNPLAAYCDELHAWPKRDLWDVLEDAFGARQNWHMISITTAGNNREGICYLERTRLIDMLEGRIKADNLFGLIYTVDKGEELQWRDRRVWFKANPNLGKGKELDYMVGLAEKADQMPSKLNTFLNKQLDIWTDVAEAWLRYDTWKALAGGYGIQDLIGKKCYAGMDLARVGDLSAVSYYFPIQPGLPKPRYWVDFYFPQDLVQEHMDEDKVPYDVWIREGHIKATPGNTTDYNFIRKDINDRDKQFNIVELGYDRHFGGELVNSLQEDGIELVEFGMGFVSMGTPTAEFERLVVACGLEHPNNPVLNWNVSNTVIVKDAAGNIKPDKKQSPKRIDGVTSSIIALGRAIAKEEKKKPNPYLKRGLRTVG